MPFLNSVRLPLIAASLIALLAACSGGPPTTPSAAAPTAAKATPRIPEQVSNPAWEADMQRFEATDAQSPPPRGGVLFIGSSSIRFWDTLAQDFPGVPVINRGFGGSELRDSTWYADRIVVPYAPRQILIYAGDNDLNAGRTPRQLHADFIAFVERVRRDLPKTKIAYISNKPSPSRAQLLSVQREANTLIAAEAKRLGVDYIDIFTPMLDASGQPDESLFIEDRLHMNRAGYVIWQRVIAPYLK
ncbi:SGNH/GDSL hydrolase family protein [Pseudoxanthomonas sp. Root630]|uniref:SGNH/GDSL hydrolase family protein n=1 Tax=Pseudoxanthomonas sp. Root630 TaxID=1736574 RepID=UPI000A6F4128|nr:SGNH/GDSL hydrolase family protein [Pseudoxanthomonas sp. Root630]